MLFPSLVICEISPDKLIHRVDVGKRKTIAEMKESNQGGNISYLVISCQEDIDLVRDVLQAKMGIFSTEFILNSVMRCEMDFDLSKYLALA